MARKAVSINETNAESAKNCCQSSRAMVAVSAAGFWKAVGTAVARGVVTRGREAVQLVKKSRMPPNVNLTPRPPLPRRGGA
ncbi:hypothetical protein GCM10022407_13570 [Hymenobacter antarcticus]|uniref:Uncharacterized protein n=1 Tax=Hymenobacter antarcticus TaxID=486270 RepID=A0ABP7PNS6_9BACT